MSRVVAPYPEGGRERDDWILSRCPARNPLDPRRPFAFFIEDERAASGEVVPTATVFLTNRECPWRCLMCDLWKNTLTETVPVGAIPEQIDWALARLNPNSALKRGDELGGTGDPPVPGGDSPPGTGGRGERFRTPAFLGPPAVIPSGQWPDGTGQWPVPPSSTSEFGLKGP